MKHSQLWLTAILALCCAAFAGSVRAQNQKLSPQEAFDKFPPFSYSMVQLHAFPNFQPTDKDLFKLMFDRIKTFRYGDDYFFLGVNSDYEEDWSSNTETLYFKYAAQLSLSRTFDRWIQPAPFLKDTLLSIQVNSGDIAYLRTVWLAGVAFDVAKLPNYGFLRVYVLVRNEDTMDTTHQVTVIWVQPFRTGKLQWIFNGWGAHWDNDTTDDVIKIEPQLRFKLSSFLSDKNFLHDVVIGTELEIGHHYVIDPVTHQLTDWEVNPSLFLAWPF